MLWTKAEERPSEKQEETKKKEAFHLYKREYERISFAFLIGVYFRYT